MKLPEEFPMPRFDTSFNFGANVKAGGSKRKAGKRKKTRGGRSTASKSRKYFSAMHGS
jgi:hypothetical protein